MRRTSPQPRRWCTPRMLTQSNIWLRFSDFTREWSGSKEDVVAREEKDMLRWFGHLERMTESRSTKQIYVADYVPSVQQGPYRPPRASPVRRRTAGQVFDPFATSKPPPPPPPRTLLICADASFQCRIGHIAKVAFAGRAPTHLLSGSRSTCSKTVHLYLGRNEKAKNG
ncbi:hypothetical protein EVAR_12536_1 [Eumeta japonica]|uniref:Uncharacterized protein n=1 Tax=Eumeta variegata TaxID=151549 RepID=A0A4C1TPQ0_EUMVA|nr:hypothetical protein EVAR_12536_1 [Eumeta japonica]